MRDPRDFDARYLEARERLLVETYALTGDLPASRSAVRDAFVAAWHHSPRGTDRNDPEAALRGLAWGRAQRRHGARPWHRERGLDPEVRATLDALAGLPAQQRRVLLLATLVGLPLAAVGRETGLPRDEVERTLELATSRYALARGTTADTPDTPDTSDTSDTVSSSFTSLAGAVAGTTWPEPEALRRAGVARRRTHTTLGVLGGLVALVVSGLVVTDTQRVRSTLEGALAGSAAVSSRTAPVEERPTQMPQPEDPLPPETLLTADEVGRQLGGRGWSATSTSDNSEGNGLLVPCQRERYADPAGEAALARRFTGPATTRGTPRAEVVQLSEVSRSPRAAERAYRAFAGWVGACAEPRSQLLATRSVEDVGEESLQLVVRDWDAPVRTSVVQVSRTGSVTTVTASTAPGDDVPDVAASARLQAAAVEGVCGLESAGACARSPRLAVVPPPPAGAEPTLLGEVDLPPVSGVTQPWVGTDPKRATTNAAATSCDDASFAGTYRGASFAGSLTRTFLVPQADLPAEFGLTETVASLPTPQAGAFVDEVRSRIASCPDRDLGTSVREIGASSGADGELTAWQLTTKVTRGRPLRFVMAVLRHQGTVAQIGFVPAPGATMSDQAFVDLADRALLRLASSPSPSPSAPRGGDTGHPR